jgi:hypothetical protein
VTARTPAGEVHAAVRTLRATDGPDWYRQLADLLAAFEERMKSTGAVEASDGKVWDTVVGRSHVQWRLALATARAITGADR